MHAHSSTNWRLVCLTQQHLTVVTRWEYLTACAVLEDHRSRRGTIVSPIASIMVRIASATPLASSTG